MRPLMTFGLAMLTTLAAITLALYAQSQSAPVDDVEYWLNQARPAGAAATAPRTGVAANAAATAPIDATAPADDRRSRPDALPGVIELSDGKVLPGMLYTTAEKSWELFVETEKRWRNIPFLAVLSISAVVAEEKMEQEWRWKEMGVPERVYTGKEYPTRRFEWKFHLIDDSTVTGTIKGQPVWLELGSAKIGPMVLHERSKGEPSQKLSDLVYVKRIIVSKRLMEQVLAQTPPK